MAGCSLTKLKKARGILQSHVYRRNGTDVGDHGTLPHIPEHVFVVGGAVPGRGARLNCVVAVAGSRDRDHGVRPGPVHRVQLCDQGELNAVFRTIKGRPKAVVTCGEVGVKGSVSP